MSKMGSTKALWRQSRRGLGSLHDFWKHSGQTETVKAQNGLLESLSGFKNPAKNPLLADTERNFSVGGSSSIWTIDRKDSKGGPMMNSNPFDTNDSGPAGIGKSLFSCFSGKTSGTNIPISAGNLTMSRNFSTYRHWAKAQSVSEPSTSPSPSPRIIPEGGFLALNNLRDNPGSRQQKTRLGRGIGSGTGKTAGRGHKGQKARNGNKPRLGFEGGQTPLRLTLPKRGFHNPFSLNFQEVNLDAIARKVDEGLIDTSQLITMKTLKDTGTMGKSTRDGVKLLGRGAEKFSLPIHIEVSRVSKRAKDAIEAAGGSVARVHYNKLGLRALMKPEWFAKKGRLLPRPARPPPRLRSAVDRVGRLPAPTTPLPVEADVISP